MLRDFTTERRDVSAEELAWVYKVGDVNKDGLIQQNEVLHVLQSWGTYEGLSAELRDVFARHASPDGALDAEALRQLLTELNAGEEVPEATARAILGHADTGIVGDQRLRRMELLGAVASWHVATGREPTSAMKVALKGLRFAGKGPVLEALGKAQSASLRFHPIRILGKII